MSKLSCDLQQLSDSENRQNEVQRSLSALDAVAALNSQSLALIAQLEQALSACSFFQTQKKSALSAQLQTEQQIVIERSSYANTILQKHHVASKTELQQLQENLSAQTAQVHTISDQIGHLQRQTQDLQTQYQHIASQIPSELREKIVPKESPRTAERGKRPTQLH